MKYNPDIHHRKSIRLKNYDYSKKGSYFVTICTKNNECIFGNIKNEKMILNEYGEILKYYWNNLPNRYENIKCDEYIIMPNHIHGIITIDVVGATVGTMDVGATFVGDCY